MAHFESDVMSSKGGSILSESSLVSQEVVILTRGLNIYSEVGIMPSEGGRAAYFRSTIFVLEMASSICCEA